MIAADILAGADFSGSSNTGARLVRRVVVDYASGGTLKITTVFISKDGHKGRGELREIIDALRALRGLCG